MLQQEERFSTAENPTLWKTSTAHKINAKATLPRSRQCTNSKCHQAFGRFFPWQHRPYIESLAPLVVLPGIHTQEKPNVRETPRFIEPLARLAVPPGVHTQEKPAPLII